MTTNIENIKTLLARFYEGQTTTDEERALADFFRQDNIPDDLLADRQLFLSLCEIADQSMPEEIAAEIDSFVRNLANEPAIQPQAVSRPRCLRTIGIVRHYLLPKARCLRTIGIVRHYSFPQANYLRTIGIVRHYSLPQANRQKLASITKFRTPPKMFYRVAATVAILIAIGGGVIAYQKQTDPFHDTCTNAEEAAEQILYANEIINRSFAPFRQSAGSAASQIDNINKTINQANKYIKL